jgi:hypothetical protein
VGGGDTRFQVFARLYSTTRHEGVTLKADLDPDAPSVETWCDVYPGSDWNERETWEMYGFVFQGHPNLIKLYLPGEFEGFPLRKDFPLLSREVKPWPGLVDVEPMPESAETEAATSEPPAAAPEPAPAKPEPAADAKPELAADAKPEPAADAAKPEPAADAKPEPTADATPKPAAPPAEPAAPPAGNSVPAVPPAEDSVPATAEEAHATGTESATTGPAADAASTENPEG